MTSRAMPIRTLPGLLVLVLGLPVFSPSPAFAARARSFKSRPIQITADGRSVWVANPDASSVSRIEGPSDPDHPAALLDCPR